MKGKTVHGFTLIELTIVLVLAGILAAVAASRFLQGDSYAAVSASDSILAGARAAQQAALGRTDATLTIRPSGNAWTVSVNAGADVLREYTLTERVVLETGGVAAAVADCSTSFDVPVAADFEVAFDPRGNVASFTNGGVVESAGPAFNGVRICVNDSVPLSVCVSPSGFASAGDCDE